MTGKKQTPISIFEEMERTICAGPSFPRDKLKLNLSESATKSQKAVAACISQFKSRGKTINGYPKIDWMLDSIKEAVIAQTNCTIENLIIAFGSACPNIAALSIIIIGQLLAEKKITDSKELDKIKEALKNAVADDRPVCLVQWLENYDYDAYAEYDHSNGLPFYIYKSSVAEEAKKALEKI